MSNKVVPAIYRSIITEVIEAVRTDFDEVGVEEAVLQELLRSWEEKVAKSRVADFSNDARMGPEARNHLPLSTAAAVAAAHAASTANGAGALASAAKVKKDAKAKASEDDDEINSDLDDPDEDVDDGDEEGAPVEGDLVIALYEKVQRTKNKWKVTLKDGLVSVGGKEYLFAKCQGEFEW